MSLPAETLERYRLLRQQKPSHDHVFEGLENKNLLALIGAHQSGKSTIARHILAEAHAQMVGDIGEIGTYTTRPRKPGNGDPNHYITADEGVTHESLLDDYENDRLLNISLLPTGHFYAHTSQVCGGNITSCP